MKLKTHQTTAKKIKVTGGKRKKKFITKHAGQDHFNARESGNTTTGKRRDIILSKVNKGNIRKLLPYSN